MASLFIEHWNDALTVTSFVLALIIGYYQISHYRAQRPRIEISDVSDPTYSVRISDDYGGLTTADDLETDDLTDSYYTATLSIANPGREDVTISSGELKVADTGEVLEILNSQSKIGLTSEPVRIGAVDSKEIMLRAIGEVRDEEHPKSVDCTIVLKSPADNVSKTVTFDREN